MAVEVKKYKAVLLEEGLGNLGTCFYYTREALEYAADNRVFEGKKNYANHPDAIEAKTLPERSVRDILGHFENTCVESGPAGQALLVGDLCVPMSPEFEWARILIESSIDNAGRFDSDIVGLSINASGVSEEKSLESFMAESMIPISAQPKLLKAKSEGIESIEVCTRLTEAVSCDMVTEAGARGRFLKVLESEKKRMAKKIDPKTAAKKNKEAEDGAAADGDATHQDKDQDVALIKKMLKTYVGGDDHSDEEVEAMKQAFGHAKDMGMEGEEAEKCAGYAMKMAKHVAEKKKETEEAEMEAEAEEAAPAAPSGKDTDVPAGDPGKAGAKKESAKIIELEARNAALEAKFAALELEKHIDKTVKESKLPEHAKKKLKECLGNASNVKDVSATLKTFKEAFGVSVQESGFNPERTGNETASGGLSFESCVGEK